MPMSEGPYRELATATGRGSPTTSVTGE